MKIALAGAFGNLGLEILKQLVLTEHDIVALDLKEKKIPELEGKYEFKEIDVTKVDTLKNSLKYYYLVFFSLHIYSRINRS